jgi:hypothetical protein
MFAMSSWRGERGRRKCCGSPASGTCQDQRLPGVLAIRNPQKSLDETDHLAAGLTLIGLGCRGAAPRGTFNQRLQDEKYCLQHQCRWQHFLASASRIFLRR